MKQRAQNRRGNFIDQVVYTGTPVTKNTPLPAGHAELHTHNSETAQKIIHNQVILDELIKNEEDLKDAVDTLEKELDGLIEASRIYFFRIDLDENVDANVPLGNTRPINHLNEVGQHWDDPIVKMKFSKLTYSRDRADRKLLGNFIYLRQNDVDYFGKEFQSLATGGGMPISRLSDMRVHVANNAEHEDFAEGNILEVSEGKKIAVFEITAYAQDPNKANRALITIKWLQGDDFTVYQSNRYDLASVTVKHSKNFDASTIYPGMEISILETDEFGDPLPHHDSYAMGVVTSVDPSDNSVSFINQYSGSGSIYEGDFVTVQFLPMGNAIEGYATIDWSNNRFANKNHTHSYSLSGHTHDHAANTHTHNYATESPDDANISDAGIFKLGAVPTGTNPKPALVSGQLYYNTEIKRFMVGL